MSPLPYSRRTLASLVRLTEFDTTFDLVSRFRKAQNRAILNRMSDIMAEEEAVRTLAPAGERLKEAHDLVGKSQKEIVKYFKASIDSKLPVPLGLGTLR